MSQRKFNLAPKRPINKINEVVEIDPVGTGLNQLLIHTSNVAETFVGARGNVTGWQGTIVTGPVFALLVILLRDGQAVSTPSLVNGSILYEPEQDVLWAWVGSWGGTTNTEGSFDKEIVIKTMRKMKSGDTLQFLAIGSLANAIQNLMGNVTMFFKQ